MAPAKYLMYSHCHLPFFISQLENLTSPNLLRISRERSTIPTPGGQTTHYSSGLWKNFPFVWANLVSLSFLILCKSHV